MLMLTTMLLLMVALAFGFSRRPWWQIGAVAIFACGPLQLAQFWMGDWRSRVGLPHHEPPLDMQLLILIVGWLLLCSYVGYVLGLAYSRWRRVGG
jgi:hypothetical protein